MSYYNYDKIRSYNALMNIIMTNRGFGKTYGFKDMAIKNFLKNGKQFMYIRRYKTDISKEKIELFFSDIQEKYPSHKFQVKGKNAYCDGKLMGYFVALSTSLNLKSVPFPNVTLMCYDEFVIGGGSQQYIKGEVTIFAELMSTVIRKRNDCRVFLLANNISMVNPYFSYFDLKPKANERFTLAKDGELVLEISTSDDFIQEMKLTKFGILFKDTHYSDYAIDNKSLLDNNSFIEVYPLKECIPVCSITLEEKKVQIWLHKNNGNYYCNEKIIETTLNFSLTQNDHSENSFLKTKLTNYPFFNNCIKAFQVGQIRFSNQFVKSTMYDIFRLLGIR